MCRTSWCVALLVTFAAVLSTGALRAHEEVVDDPAAEATKKVVTGSVEIFAMIAKHWVCIHS